MEGSRRASRFSACPSHHGSPAPSEGLAFLTQWQLDPELLGLLGPGLEPPASPPTCSVGPSQVSRLLGCSGEMNPLSPEEGRLTLSTDRPLQGVDGTTGPGRKPDATHSLLAGPAPRRQSPEQVPGAGGGSAGGPLRWPRHFPLPQQAISWRPLKGKKMRQATVISSRNTGCYFWQSRSCWRPLPARRSQTRSPPP